MPISVTCQSCSKKYRLKDELAGKSIRCRECGESIRVGQGNGAGEPRRRQRTSENSGRTRNQSNDLPPRRRASASGSKSKSRRTATSSKKVKPVVWIAGGIGIVGLIIAGSYLLISGNEDSVASTETPATASPDTTSSTDPSATAVNSSEAQPPLSVVSPENSAPEVEDPASTAPNPSATPAVAANSPSPTPAADLNSSNASVANNTSQPSGAAATGFPLEPDSITVEWSRNPRIELSPTASQLEYPSAPTPVVATGFSGGKFIGSESWNLATGKKIGQLQGQAGNSGARSLSPDGRILAALDGGRQNVEIWSYETGQRVGSIPIEQGNVRVNDMLCPSSTRLITYTLASGAGGFQKTLKLFDTTNGQLLKTITPENNWNLKSLGVSFGGRYLTAMDNKSGTTIYLTDSLEAIASVPAPNGFQGTAAGAAFNAAGTQLATVWTTYNETRVVTVNLADGSTTERSFPGNLTMSPITGSSYVGPAIEWLPDGSGWLLFGRTLVDAESGHRLWVIDSEGVNGTVRRQLLPNGLLVRSGGFDLETGRRTPPELKVIQWPSADVQKSLAALASDGAAKIKAGAAVGVQVEIGELKHGQPDETRGALEKVLQERLAADGMTHGDNTGAILYAHYSEMSGQEMFQRQNRGRPGRQAQPPAGSGIQSTVALIKLEYRLPGESQPAWTGELVVNPSVLIIRGNASDQSARDAMFRTAQWQITAAPIPYFIPEDKALATLPGQTMYESR